jgi:hypothetical protein
MSVLSRLGLLLMLLSMPASWAQCTLGLDIVPTLSTWNVTTRVEWNTDTYRLGTPGASDIGVQGRIFVLTAGPCPTTVATALEILEGATFSGLEPLEMVSIRVWPPSIQSTVQGVGRLDLRSVEWALSSEEITGVALTDTAVGGVMLQVCTHNSSFSLVLARHCEAHACLIHHLIDSGMQSVLIESCYIIR